MTIVRRKVSNMKGDIYILNQPRKNIMSILVVDTPTMTSDLHAGLDQLSERADVMLVFCDALLPTGVTIDRRKFTSLYQGSGWIDAPDDNPIFPALLCLEYDQELYPKRHLGYTIGTLTGIMSEPAMTKIERLTRGTITKPILNIQRLDVEELRKIYMTPTQKKSWWKKSEPQDPDKWINMRFKSDSGYAYFGKSMVRNFLETTDSYVSSFHGTLDPLYFIASFLKKQGLDNINCSVEDLKINNLDGKV